MARLVSMANWLFFGFGVDLWNDKFKREITTMKAKLIIHNVIKSINSTITTDDHLRLLRKQIEKDFPKDAASTDPVPQFVADMERDISFIRVEQGESGIHDTTSQPSRKMKSKERVKEGVAALQALLKTEKDKRWEKTLQLLSTQTGFNNTFDPFILLFDLESANNQWTDPIDGVGYALHAVFSNTNKPPIKLEIFRDSNGSIKDVLVTVEGQKCKPAERYSGSISN